MAVLSVVFLPAFAEEVGCLRAGAQLKNRTDQWGSFPSRVGTFSCCQFPF